MVTFKCTLLTYENSSSFESHTQPPPHYYLTQVFDLGGKVLRRSFKILLSSLFESLWMIKNFFKEYFLT